MRTPHAKIQLRKRREADFWRGINRCLIFLTGLCLLVLAALWFVPELRRIDDMHANLANLEKQLAAEQLLLLQQQREEKWLNEDPNYVELRARDLLGVIKEGETVFRLDDPSPTLPMTPKSDPK